MSQTVLQLDNVEFRRNRRVIITDVNLTINAGERWVLFGPNGIGKSTAVGMLATRTFPSEGRVFILGHQLGKYDVFKLRTRIGLASADLGRQFPEFEDPLDAVVTGLSAVTGRGATPTRTKNTPAHASCCVISASPIWKARRCGDCPKANAPVC